MKHENAHAHALKYKHSNGTATGGCTALKLLIVFMNYGIRAKNNNGVDVDVKVGCIFP